MLLPLIRLDLAKNNFIFQATCIWNGLIQKLMNRSSTNSLGIIIHGSSSNSDLSTSISLIKNKIKNVLLYTQKIDPLKTLIGQSRSMEWYPDNFSRLITLPSAYHYAVEISSGLKMQPLHIFYCTKLVTCSISLVS